MTEYTRDELHVKANGLHQNIFINKITLCFKHTLSISGAFKLVFSRFYRQKVESSCILGFINIMKFI